MILTYLQLRLISDDTGSSLSGYELPHIINKNVKKGKKENERRKQDD